MAGRGCKQPRDVREGAVYADEAQSLTLRALLAEVRNTLRKSQKRIWTVPAVLVPVVAVFTYLGFVRALRPELIEYGWIITMARLSISAIAMVAAYRAILTRDPNIWRLDRATLRFAAGAALIVGLAAGIIILCGLWASAFSRALAVQPGVAMTLRAAVFTFAAMLVSIAFLRAQPWLAALAIDRREITLQRSWLATTNMTRVLISAWLLLVMPLMIAHAALMLVTMRLPWASAIHGPTAMAAALLVAALAVVTALLNATIFRLIARSPAF